MIRDAQRWCALDAVEHGEVRARQRLEVDKVAAEHTGATLTTPRLVRVVLLLGGPVLYEEQRASVLRRLSEGDLIAAIEGPGLGKDAHQSGDEFVSFAGSCVKGDVHDHGQMVDDRSCVAGAINSRGSSTEQRFPQ